jgi:gliding motility-associated-like protein
MNFRKVMKIYLSKHTPIQPIGSTLKKLFLLVLTFFAFSSVELWATHIIGGELTYECLGNNRYRLILKVYRDCSSSANPLAVHDNPAWIGIYNYEGNVLKSEINGGFVLVNTNKIDKVNGSIASDCGVLEDPVCVDYATYVRTITLPKDPDGYTIVYQRCCRNNDIKNIIRETETGMTLETKISREAQEECNEGNNYKGSPVFKEWPPIYVCLGQQINYDHSAIGLTGQGYELRYSLVTPLDMDGNLPSQPKPAQPPFDMTVEWDGGASEEDMLINAADPLKIDPVTGLLTGTPNTEGAFLVGVLVEQLKDGKVISYTRRDFQYNVRVCTDGTIASFEAPEVVCDAREVSFVNTSSNALNYRWYFDYPNLEPSTTEPNPTFVFPDTGAYTVLLEAWSDTNCIARAFKLIKIGDTTLEPDFGISKEDCDPQAPWLLQDLSVDSIHNIVSWEWMVTQNNGVIFESNVQNPSFVPSVFGVVTITLTATSSNGCGASISKTLTLVNLEDESIDGDLEKCLGDSLALNPNFNPAISYVWTPSEGLNDNTLGNPIATLTETTLFSVVLTDTLSNCQRILDSILVVVNPLPEVNPLDAVATKCVEEILLVLEVEDPDGYTYQWEPASNVIPNGFENSPTPTVLVEYDKVFIFTFTVTDTLTGCQTIGEIEVSFENLQFPDFTTLDTIVVEACELLDFVLQIEPTDPNADYSYEWSPEDCIVSGANSSSPVVNIIFGECELFSYVVVDNESFCEVSGEVLIQFENLIFPDVSFESLVDSECKDTLQLLVTNNDPTQNLVWTWTAVGGEILEGGDTCCPLVSIASSSGATFTFVVTNDLGCKETGSITVEVNPDNLDLEFDHTVDCETGEVTFVSTGNAGANLMWNFGDGATGVGDSVVHKYLSSGTYVVTLSSMSQICGSASFSKEIFVTLFDFGDTTLVKCGGPGLIELNPNGNPDFEYTWNTDPISNEANPIVLVEMDTQFSVTVYDPKADCSISFVVEVLVSPEFAIETDTLINICGDGSAIELNASASLEGIDLDWLVNGNSIGKGTTLTINPSEDTNILLVGTDSLGCEESASIRIVTRKVSISLEDTQPFYCFRDEITVNLNADEGNLIQEIVWNPASMVIAGQGTQQAIFSMANDPSVTLSVEVIYTDGCVKGDNITLEVCFFDPPVLATADPSTIFIGESTDLFTEFNPDYIYQWEPRQFFNAGDDKNNSATVFVPDTTLFTVFVTNECGCIDSSSVLVNVAKDCEVFVPKAFSPNGDGSNDVLFVRGFWIDKIEFVIYNRWGQEVFKTNTVGEGWDGRINGVLSTPDVFAYYVKATCRSGEEIVKQGNITLLQ